MSAVLDLVGVCKSFGAGAGAVQALREVTMSVTAGELVAVMGPSGSGKSSLLTIGGTLERATSGDVRVDGHLVADLSPAATAALRRRSIGFVFQDYNLLAGLTAAENVAMPLELDGMKARAARAAARAPSSVSIWRIAPSTTPTTCPAASASASPSPGRSSASVGWSSPTSRPARSTR